MDASKLSSPTHGSGRTERRKEKRLRKHVLVRFVGDDDGHTAITSTISESGAFIRTDHTPAEGTEIRLELSLPDQTFSLVARVVWVNQVSPQEANVLGNGIGVSFIDAGDDWGDFVRRLRE